MTQMGRALSTWAFDELSTGPMAWIVGPRQVGKTFLARSLPSSTYFNWDTPEVRKAVLRDPYFFRSEKPIVIFDEIHKRRDWKKLLKGYYDSPSRTENFVVTGSGRMDQYQRGGDSLQGRYFSYHLWPLSPDEIHTPKGPLHAASPRNFKVWQPDSNVASDADLLRLGGFPQPFIVGKTSFLNRWKDQYLERLVREDVRDFSSTLHLDKMDMLARLLPERSQSPVSLLSLAEDLEASPVGVKNWLRLFEVLFFGFLLKPYHRKIHRAVKKEAKWYFQQWAFVDEPGARFENYLAVQLSSCCSAWREQGQGLYELFYLRDQDKREVDFLICKDLQPLALIEAKNSPQPWPAALHFYTQRLKIPGFLVYPSGPTKRQERGWSLSSAAFLKNLWLKTSTG